MNDLKKANEIYAPKLSDLLTPEQEILLAQLLAELIGHKWGILQIDIVEGKVQFFRPMPSIDAYHLGPY